MNSLGLAIEILLLTNLWVFAYTRILPILNSWFPVKLSEEFYITGAAPEPFEIPVYLALTIFTVFIFFLIKALLLKFSLRKENQFRKTSIRRFIAYLVIFLALLVIFISNIDGYPLKGAYDPYQFRPDKSFYSAVLILYLAFVSLVIGESILINKLTRGTKLAFIPFLIIILAIAFLTFEPNFPISGLDYSFFYGPIWEIAQGRTIFTQTPSQYGLLPVLIPTFFYKLNLFRLTHLQIYFWLFYVVEYFLLFFLIFKVGKSLPLALIAIFSVITINFFSIFHVPLFTPQAGPMRWIPMFIILFFSYRTKRIDSKLIVFLVALSAFWMLDSGLYIMLAYFLTLFLLLIKKIVGIKRVLISGIWLFIYLFLILMFIQIFHLLLGYQLVDIVFAFGKIQQYARAGFNMIIMPKSSYFWFLILVYFASIVYFSRRQKLQFLDQLLLFAANLSLFGGLYFVGRSHLHTLFWISPIVLFNLFLLIGLAYSNKNSKIPSFILVGLFLLTFVYPAYARKEMYAELLRMRYDRLIKGDIFGTELDSYLAMKYGEEKKLIEVELPEKKVAILHADDTYLLYMTGKQSSILANPQTWINSKKDLEFALKEVYGTCPRKIAIDCRFVGKCNENWVFTAITNFIQPVILEKIEKECRLKYKPTLCTEQLCIAEAGDKEGF